MSVGASPIGVPSRRVSSIGSSNNSWLHFQHLLQAAAIRMLIDVRSQPRSRHAHFGQAALRANLVEIGVAYLYLGHQLGGLPTSGSADYEAMALAPQFEDGLRCVEEEADKQETVLMCSEHEPIECHRCLLIGRALAERGTTVVHLMRDGSRELQTETEQRLLTLARKREPDLLISDKDRLTAAYRLQNQRLSGMTRPSARGGRYGSKS